MPGFDWRENVVKDYRDRILVDPDNPILAQRANKDRYTSPKNRSEYAGHSHLGTSSSNDAIIWNVFRFLQKAGRLDIIADELGIGEPRGLLLWGLAPELDGKNAELQFVTGNLVRGLDTTFAEGVPEPDVTILGTTGIAVGMGASELGGDTTHLWEGSLEQVGQLRAYREKNPGFVRADINKSALVSALTDNDLMPVYQLVKLTIFAKELGARFGVEPMVITMASTRAFFSSDVESSKTAADRWNAFVGTLGEDVIKCKELLWQNIIGLKADPSVVGLGQYILNHPYLYSFGEVI
jgi:hypothetical protein